MYIDLLVLIILLILVVFFFQRFSSFVFFVAIVDIFLRIFTFIKNNIGLKDIAAVIDKYLPENVLEIINRYTGGISWLNIIVKWCYAGIMSIFLIYIIKIFWSKKKI